MFYHPTMRFQFPVPKDWRVVNSASTVMIVNPDKNALVQLKVAEGDSPEKAADTFVTKNEVTVRSRQTTTVHGFPAVVVTSTGQTEGAEIGILSYFIKKAANVYAFHGYSEASVFSSYSAAFSGVMGGFEEVRDRSVLERKPQRLHIKKAPKSGNLASILGALGMKKEMLDEGAILNGLKLDDRVQQGDWIKVVGD